MNQILFTQLLETNQHLHDKISERLESIRSEQTFIQYLLTELCSKVLNSNTTEDNKSQYRELEEEELFNFDVNGNKYLDIILSSCNAHKRKRDEYLLSLTTNVSNVNDNDNSNNDYDYDDDHECVKEEWSTNRNAHLPLKCKIRKMRRKATYIKWTYVANKILRQYIQFHEINVFAPYEPNIWTCVQKELHRLGFRSFDAIDCYRQGQYLLSSMHIFTREEDVLLNKFVYELGKEWWCISEKMSLQTQRKRTPFQLAYRYRDIMRSTMIEKRLSLDAVWERIRQHLHTNENNDYYRVCVSVNNDCQDGEMLLSPVTIRRVMEYNLIMNMGTEALFWKVFAILCNIDYPYQNKLHIFAIRTSTRYSQLSLSEVVCLTKMSANDIRQRIRDYLLRVRRRLDTLNYEKISHDLFGHQNCALLVFQETC